MILRKQTNKQTFDSILKTIPFSYSAGARDESYDLQGLTRILRIGAGLSNKNSSEFRIRTNIKATGGSLGATADRETFTYSLQVKRDNLDTGLRFLHDVSNQQDFRYWELKDISSRLSDDLINVTDTDRAIDALHQAAFNRGLGNVLYAGHWNVSNITADALQNFVSTNFTSNRAAIVGVGIDHESLLSFAKSFQLQAGTAAASPSKYNVGQVKIDRAGSLATVAVGTQGAAATNQKEALAFTVLRLIAGNGRLIRKYSVHLYSTDNMFNV